MATELEANSARPKNIPATPESASVAAKPAAPAAAAPATAPVAPPAAVKAVPPVASAPAPVAKAPVSVAKVVSTPAVRPVTTRGRPKGAKATAVKAPKAVKAAKPLKAVKAPKVKAVAVKKPRVTAKVNAAKVKPAIKATTEPFMDVSKLFESQMKKLGQSWFLKDIDTGDLHIANAELREVVESTQKAAVEGIRAINKEMEKFIRHSVDENFAAVSQLMGAKSLPELLEVQYKLAQDRLQTCVEQGQKFKSIANDTAYSAFTPLNDNLTQAIGGFAKFRFF